MKLGITAALALMALATPAAHRPLPGVLKQSEAAALLEVVTTRADDGDPVHLRDRLILELL